jgi:hypothetical protein
MVQVWNKFMVDSGAKSSAAYDRSPLGVDDYMLELMSSTWIPLHFFFCDNTYLPLVAIQYHEVEIRVKFSSSGAPTTPLFYANYVMLDTDERKMIVDTPHELLIEQVQRIPFDSSKFNLGLLNHPVKCLLWGSDNAVTDDVQLYLNGTEIFNQPMPAKFFRQVQGYYHSDFNNSELANLSSYLFMYSFSVKANKHQPSGTCNFSRMDTSTLNLTVDSGTLNYLHAVNYNILRIKKGMAGLAFSN